MILKDEILILKEIKYKDYDKILHAYSKKNGKIQIISRGCRKAKSKLISSSQNFSYSECVLYKNKDMYILNSADLKYNFYKLREDINKYFYACYVLELINYIIQENIVEINIFNMTIKVLKCLEDRNINEKLLISSFEIKLISMLGYKPNIKKCIKCKDNLNSGALFSIEDGGFYCSNCIEKSKLGIKMNFNEIKSLDKILMTKFEDISKINNINNRVFLLIRKYLFYYIGKNNFESLKIIEKGEING